MEFVIDMQAPAWALVIGGGLVFGVIAQFVGRTETGWEWLIDGIGFVVGAVVASELIIAFQTVEPMWEGLALVPALIGGIVVGLLVDVATRYVTGGSPFTHHPMSV
ncbi:MAG TPA: hypothetical protein VJZ72_11260 [Candidatus Limnocylindrales bacterium]|nr:hypothetical protein [Candidatus Limnocylindrales bacterium]